MADAPEAMVLRLVKLLALTALVAPAAAFAPSSASSSALARRAPGGALGAPVAAPGRSLVVVEAVPKKGQSKMKTRQRKANWFAKARLQKSRALTLGRSVLKNNGGSFVYIDDKGGDDEDDDEDDDDEEEEDDDDE